MSKTLILQIAKEKKKDAMGDKSLMLACKYTD